MPWRNLAKLIVVAAFFAVCFVMLADVIGLDSPWLGLLMMFYFMGLAKVAEPLFVFRMPHALRAVDPASLGGPLYVWLGVRGFGNLLRNTPLRLFNRSVYRLDGKRSFAQVLRQAESAEATHFWAATGFTLYIGYVLARGFMLEALVFLAVQMAVNVYPILHLRLIRARLDRVGLVAGKRQATGGQ